MANPSCGLGKLKKSECLCGHRGSGALALSPLTRLLGPSQAPSHTPSQTPNQPPFSEALSDALSEAISDAF